MSEPEPRIPLIELSLQLTFHSLDASQERLAFIDQTLPPSESIIVDTDRLELLSREKVSYGRLRDRWSITLPMILSTLGIDELQTASLTYLNEIPLQNLRNFQTYLNISFEMTDALKDRIEFFRTEFIYKYEFGEIRVWLQPDWNDQIEGYCIQLNMESRTPGPINADDLILVIDRMHSGLKDVFRQILSNDYVRQLPQ